MIDDTLIYADRELCMRYPRYAALPPQDRQCLLEYARDVRASGQYMGDFGASAVIAIISIVSAVIAAGVGIASSIIESRRSGEYSRTAAATQSVLQSAKSIEGQTATIDRDTSTQEKTMKVAMFGLLGVAGVVTAISIFT